MTSIELSHNIAQATARLDGLQADIGGGVFDPNRRASLGSSAENVRKAAAEKALAGARIESLTVRAPFDGLLVDVPTSLRKGIDLSRREPLGVLIDPQKAIVEAYVDEKDLERIQVGAKAIFTPEILGEKKRLRVTHIDHTSTKMLEPPELSSLNGGGIGVRKDASGKSIPEDAVYRVLLSVEEPTTIMRQRGIVSIDGERSSIIQRLYHRTIAVIIRESGI